MRKKFVPLKIALHLDEETAFNESEKLIYIAQASSHHSVTCNFHRDRNVTIKDTSCSWNRLLKHRACLHYVYRLTTHITHTHTYTLIIYSCHTHTHTRTHDSDHRVWTHRTTSTVSPPPPPCLHARLSGLCGLDGGGGGDGREVLGVVLRACMRPGAPVCIHIRAQRYVWCLALPTPIAGS